MTTAELMHVLVSMHIIGGKVHTYPITHEGRVLRAIITRTHMGVVKEVVVVPCGPSPYGRLYHIVKDGMTVDTCSQHGLRKHIA